MEKKELEECKKRLLEAKAKILERYRAKEETQKRLEEESKEPGDIEDIGQVSYTEELLDNLSQIEIKNLQEIDYSLKKIEAGTYGICESCGEDIPFERLCAVPWTRYCAKCAEEIEKEEGTFMPSYGFEPILTEDIQIERDDISEV